MRIIFYILRLFFGIEIMKKNTNKVLRQKYIFLDKVYLDNKGI